MGGRPVPLPPPFVSDLNHTSPLSSFRDQRHILGTRLKALLKALRKGGLVAGKAIVIKARVPIIKCQLTMGVAADISLGAVNGAAAVQYIQAQVGAGGRNSRSKKWVSAGGAGVEGLGPHSAPPIFDQRTHPPTPFPPPPPP